MTHVELKEKEKISEESAKDKAAHASMCTVQSLSNQSILSGTSL